MIVEQPQEVQELPEYQRLIEVGNERGTLAFGEIVEALAEHELEPDAMDAVKGMIEAEGIEIGPSPQEADHIAAFALPIDDLDLTVRSYNCLKREGIHTVGELIGRSEADLLDIRNFGAKSIDEVKVKLVTLGLALKDSPPGFDPGAAVYFSDDEDDDDLGYVEDEQL